MAGEVTAARSRPSVRGLLRDRRVESTATVVGFCLLFAGYGIWLGSTYFSVDARVLDIHSNVPILVLGLAVLVTLNTGLFDLSIAGMCTLTTFLTIGWATHAGWPFALVIASCLLVGALGGLLNAFLVEGLGINAFIATLGSGGIFTGIAAVYSGGTNMIPLPEGPALPTWFSDMGSYATKPPTALLWCGVACAAVGAYASMSKLRPAVRAGIVIVGLAFCIGVLDLDGWIDHASWLVTILLVLAIALWVLFQHTAYGRRVQAIGSNRNAARLAGVPVTRDIAKAFVLGGVLAAVAGVLLAANQGSAAPDVAAAFLLPAFAAAFLSTVVFSTGHFTVWGTVLGGIFVVWVAQGLVVGGLPPTWTTLVNGVVLVCAVALSTFLRRRK